MFITALCVIFLTKINYNFATRNEYLIVNG